MARRLYLPSNLPEFTKEEENDIYQRFFKGYNAFKDRHELKDMIEEITLYRKELKTLNIQDYQVKTLKLTPLHLLFNFSVSLIRMAFSLVFALPGILMLIPLGLIIAYFAEKERRKALAESSVKVLGVDVMASVKVGASLILYPLYCFTFCILTYLFCVNKLEWTSMESFKAMLVMFFLFPFCSLSKL